MYPELDNDVSVLLEEDGLDFDFHRGDDPRTSTKDYDTNIMGRFTCDNQKCSSNGWSSKRIAITIRLYHGSEYNARVYHQRCQQCDKLSKPHLDSSYAERVAYRLKKWSGVKLGRPPYRNKQSKGPHQADLCEGCKDGHCTQS